MDAETAFTTVALLLMITRMSQVHSIFAQAYSSTRKTPYPLLAVQTLVSFKLNVC